MRLVRVTFVARLFGEMTSTVLPERVPEVIRKLWSNANVEITKISLLPEGK